MLSIYGPIENSLLLFGNGILDRASAVLEIELEEVPGVSNVQVALITLKRVVLLF